MLALVSHTMQTMNQEEIPKIFSIYRASAGSGKTYTLTYNYLRLALKYPDYFKSILAVTFTNKATQEMKSRIVETLTELSKGAHSMSSDLMRDLAMTDVQLQNRAALVLNTILHNYSFFAITTIDAFFQRVVRSFAKEIGMHTGFKIELNQGKVLTEVINEMIQGISEDPQLLRWLTDFAISEINEGKSWDTNKSILSLSGELFKDELVAKKTEVFEKLEDATFMDQVLSRVREQLHAFEKEYRQLGEEAVFLCKQYGLEMTSFTYGAAGVGGYFYKVAEGEIKEPGTRVKKAVSDDAWVAKTSKEKEVVMQAVEGGLRGLVASMVTFYEENIRTYRSFEQVSKRLYAFGLLSRVSQEIARYKEENDMLLISDFQLFLHDIISDSDSPYVYEKIGTRYNHYLIDEFQDTSSLHWDNFRPLVQDSLASGNFNMIVGDVKQSIYRWRGGDWDILLSKVKQGVDPALLDEQSLKTNRRSKQNIVEFNNLFFEHAPVLLESTLESKIGAKQLRIQEAYQASSQELFDESATGLIQLQFYDKSEEEEDFPLTKLIADVQSLQDAKYGLSDIAILVRKNNEGRQVAEALMNHQRANPKEGYRYDVLSNESLFIKNNKSVHLILQVLHYLQYPSERLAEKQVEYALSSCYVAEDVAMHMQQIEAQRLYWKSLRLSELVNTLVRQFDLMDVEEDLPYVLAIQDAVEDFLEYEPDTILDFMNWWSDHDKRSIQVSGDQDAITIMTIHQSKGLQFKAVLLPYCSWSLDHSGGFREQLIWSEQAKSTEMLGMPLVPVKYSAALGGTVFSEDYQAEMHDIHLDNLNMLYVAMTRAEEALLITAPVDGYKPALLKTAGHLIYHFALEQRWITEEESLHRIGELPALSEYQHDLMPAFTIHPRKITTDLGEHVALRYKSRILEETQIESINYGDIVHWIFSKITKRSEFGEAIDLAVMKFGLNPDEVQEIKDRLRQIWDLPGVSQWFTDDWEVKNEASILLSDGKMKRPDRVVIRDNKALIIDYKTGAKSAGHIRQVEEYKSILSKMGYGEVAGYLIYFSEPELVAV